MFDTFPDDKESYNPDAPTTARSEDRMNRFYTDDVMILCLVLVLRSQLSGI